MNTLTGSISSTIINSSAEYVITARQAKELVRQSNLQQENQKTLEFIYREIGVKAVGGFECLHLDRVRLSSDIIESLRTQGYKVEEIEFSNPCEFSRTTVIDWGRDIYDLLTSAPLKEYE